MASSNRLPDYYKILEIDQNADIEAIKKAYKRMALKYHPDRNRGENEKHSEDQFKLISEAYAVLSNSEKKMDYDAAMRGGFGGTDTNMNGSFGSSGGPNVRFRRAQMDPDEIFNIFNNFFNNNYGLRNKGGMGGGFPFPTTPPFGGIHVDPIHQMHHHMGMNIPIFEEPPNLFHHPFSPMPPPFSTFHQNIHQQQHQQQQQQQQNVNRKSNMNRSGSNTTHHVGINVDDLDEDANAKNKPNRIMHSINLVLSFNESVYGTERSVSFPIKVECNMCNGTGSATKQREFMTCNRCNGNGRVSNLVSSFTCDNCDGKGVILKNLCNFCTGEGLISQKYEDSIIIPAGVSDRSCQTAIFKIKRPKSFSYDEYELLVKFNIEKHPFFHRDQGNVIITVPLSMTQALFGGPIEVPTIYSKLITINVPPFENQSKYGIVVYKHGFKDPDGKGAGDMIVNFTIDEPTLSSITPREKELYKEIAQIEKTRLTNNQSQYYEFTKQWVSQSNQKQQQQQQQQNNFNGFGQNHNT